MRIDFSVKIIDFLRPASQESQISFTFIHAQNGKQLAYRAANHCSSIVLHCDTAIGSPLNERPTELT